MKILSAEEVAQGNFLPNTPRGPLTNALLKLEVGQALYITAAEWTWKNRSPNAMASRAGKQSGRTFEVLKQNGVRAWAVKRVA